jgi:hypothetical protein
LRPTGNNFDISAEETHANVRHVRKLMLGSEPNLFRLAGFNPQKDLL